MKIPVWVVELTLAGFAGGILGACGLYVTMWQYWVVVIPLVGLIKYFVDQSYLYHKSKVNKNEKEKTM